MRFTKNEKEAYKNQGFLGFLFLLAVLKEVWNEVY